MALFSFFDLVPAPASAELRQALKVDADEPLLGRRLRGVGRWDSGRLAVEVIVPSRLPADLNYRVEGLLDQTLYVRAPEFKYGEYVVEELRERYRADELVVMHTWGSDEDAAALADRSTEPDELDWDWESIWRPFAVQVFFNPPMLRHVRYWPLRLRMRLRRSLRGSRSRVRPAVSTSAS